MCCGGAKTGWYRSVQVIDLIYTISCLQLFMGGIGAAAMCEKLVQLMRSLCAKRMGQDYCHYKDGHGIAWE